MKRLIIATTALTFALPAYAQVEDPCEHFNESRDSGEEVNCDLEDTGISAEAAGELADIEENDPENPDPTVQQIRDDDRGIVNEEAAEQLREIEAEEEEGDI